MVSIDFFSPTIFSIRFPDACSFLLIVSPLAMCNTCVMLGSSVRSHSHVLTRSGRPNVFRKYEATFESGNCKARQPVGYPGNAVGAPVTCDQPSNNTSAINRRG